MGALVTGVQTCALPISVGVDVGRALLGAGPAGAVPAVLHGGAPGAAAVGDVDTGGGLEVGWLGLVGSSVGEQRRRRAGAVGRQLHDLVGRADHEVVGAGASAVLYAGLARAEDHVSMLDRKSTRLNSSH